MRVLPGCLFGLILGLSSLCLAQQPDTLWSSRVQYLNQTELFNLMPVSDGGYLGVGRTHIGAIDYMFAARLDSIGNTIWANEYDNNVTANEQAFAAVELPGHTFVIAGYGNDNRGVRLRGMNAGGIETWNRLFVHTGIGQPGQTRAQDLVVLPTGGFYVVGYCLGIDQQHSDLWLLRCTDTGDTLWTRVYGSDSTDIGLTCRLMSDGALMLVGNARSYGHGSYDVWVMLVDTANGDLRSEQLYGDANLNRAYGIAVQDTTLFVAGRSLDGMGSNGYVLKTGIHSAAQWAVSYNNSSDEDQYRGVAARPAGGAVCVGWTGSDVNHNLPWLSMIREDGSLEYSWWLTGISKGAFYNIINLRSGGYLACGTVTEDDLTKGYVLCLAYGVGVTGVVRDLMSNAPIRNVSVAAIGRAGSALTNSAGEYLLELPLGTYQLLAVGPCTSPDTAVNVTVFPDSGAVVNFWVGEPEFSSRQTSINCTVPNHSAVTTPFAIYNRGSGPMNFSIVCDPRYPALPWLSVDPASGVVPPGDSLEVMVRAAADTTDDGVYDYYGFVVIHAHACPDSVVRIPVLATVLDAPERDLETVSSFALHAAYPNPFNPATTLQFDLPHPGATTIAVYDLTGRRVQTLVSGDLSAGRHRVTFTSNGLASGVYLARMSAPGFSATQKLLLMK